MIVMASGFCVRDGLGLPIVRHSVFCLLRIAGLWTES